MSSSTYYVFSVFQRDRHLFNSPSNIRIINFQNLSVSVCPCGNAVGTDILEQFGFQGQIITYLLQGRGSANSVTSLLQAQRKKEKKKSNTITSTLVILGNETSLAVTSVRSFSILTNSIVTTGVGVLSTLIYI